MCPGCIQKTVGTWLCKPKWIPQKVLMGLPSEALIPSTPHLTQEQRTCPRKWMAQRHRVNGRTRRETLCPDFQPQLTPCHPRKLAFSVNCEESCHVCLLGHLRLDHVGERMSWCSAFNLFLLLLLAIKVLLISHNLIYISYLLFLWLMQCSQSGGTPSPPAPFSPLTPFFHLECPALQQLWLSISTCLGFRLQESFLEIPSFGEATKAMWVDPFRSQVMQNTQSYLLLVSTVLFHSRLDASEGRWVVGRAWMWASGHVGLNSIPVTLSVVTLGDWFGIFKPLCTR